MKFLALIPTVRGISQRTVQSLWDGGKIIEKNGGSFAWGSLEGMPLDLARNELMTVFLSTTCDIAICQDDDVAVEPVWYLRMSKVIEAGAKIVTAPCRMRSEGHMANVVPADPFRVYDLGGCRVMDCRWTGFGCVMIHRSVFEDMFSKAMIRDTKVGSPSLTPYRSTVMPDHMSCDLFRSIVVNAREIFPNADADHNEYLLDDRAFCYHVTKAGYTIQAVIDVPTWHRGLSLTLGEEMERFDRAAAAAEKAATQKKIIIPNKFQNEE